MSTSTILALLDRTDHMVLTATDYILISPALECMQAVYLLQLGQRNNNVHHLAHALGSISSYVNQPIIYLITM